MPPAARAAAAAAVESNKPKQVAPEPDMRASRQPGSARSAASTSRDHRLQAIAGASRSLRLRRRDSRASASRASADGVAELAIDALPADGPAEGMRNTSCVGSATPGLTSTAGKRRQMRAARDSISPMPRMRRGRGSRQTGTSAPVAGAACEQARIVERKAVGRASSRKAAAASAEPPPSPAATGKRFDQAEAARACKPSTRAAQRAGGLEHEIVGGGRRLPAAVGPSTLERERAPGRQASARRRRRRRRPGFRCRDSRRRGGRARAASD